MRTIHPRSRTLLAAGLFAGIALSGSVTANAGTSSAPQARSGATCADPGTGRDSLKVIGLTDFQRLMCFDENTPGQITNIGRISGLEDDVRIVGIDHRPASGDLYGLGDQGGVYVLDETDASADLRSRLNVELGGGQYDIDFNPTVDRLRIVSNMGQNLRANVDDGATIVDGPLNSAGPPPVNPVRGVGGAAYTNNDADANTATTLFDIDGLADQVVIQAPANSGLAASSISQRVHRRLTSRPPGPHQCVGVTVWSRARRITDTNEFRGEEHGGGRRRSGSARLASGRDEQREDRRGGGAGADAR